MDKEIEKLKQKISKGCGKLLDADEWGTIYCGTNGTFLCSDCEEEYYIKKEEILNAQKTEFSFTGKERNGMSDLGEKSNTHQTKPPITVGLSEIVSKNRKGHRLGARDKNGETPRGSPSIEKSQGEGK